MANWGEEGVARQWQRKRSDAEKGDRVDEERDHLQIAHTTPGTVEGGGLKINEVSTFRDCVRSGKGCSSRCIYTAGNNDRECIGEQGMVAFECATGVNKGCEFPL